MNAKKYITSLVMALAIGYGNTVFGQTEKVTSDREQSQKNTNTVKVFINEKDFVKMLDLLKKNDWTSLLEQWRKNFAYLPLSIVTYEHIEYILLRNNHESS